MTRRSFKAAPSARRGVAVLDAERGLARHAEGHPEKISQFERLLGGDTEQVAKVLKGERINDHHP